MHAIAIPLEDRARTDLLHRVSFPQDGVLTYNTPAVGQYTLYTTCLALIDAPFDGVVTRVTQEHREDRHDGSQIELRGDDGLYVLVTHAITSLKEGDRVVHNSPMARVGNYAIQTQPHVHMDFYVEHNPRAGIPIELEGLPILEGCQTTADPQKAMEWHIDARKKDNGQAIFFLVPTLLMGGFATLCFMYDEGGTAADILALASTAASLVTGCAAASFAKGARAYHHAARYIETHLLG